MPELSLEQIEARVMARVARLPLAQVNPRTIIGLVIDVVRPEVLPRPLRFGRVERTIIKVLADRSVLGPTHAVEAVIGQVVDKLSQPRGPRDTRRQFVVRALRNLHAKRFVTLGINSVTIEDSLLQL